MKRIALVLVTLAVPVILIALNVRLLASEPFLRWEYGRAGFPEAPGLTDSERLALATESTLFIVRDEDPAVLSALRVKVRDEDPAVLSALRDGYAPLYTPAEIDHLLDVRLLVRRISAVAAAGLALVVVVGILWWRSRAAWRGYPRAVGRGGWLTVAAVILIGLGIAVAWPLVFVGFHQLLFPPGTWSFPVDSGLIRLFPNRFWFDAAVAFGALSAVWGLIVALVARWVDRRFGSS